MIFLAVTNLIALEIPALAKEIVNEFVPNIRSEALELVALSIMGLGMGQILVRCLSRVLIFWPGRQLEMTSKNSIFDRLVRHPLMFFAKKETGDIVSRISNDIGHLRVLFAFGALQVINIIFISLFTIFRMYTVHPKLATLCLTPIILMLVLARLVMPKLGKHSRSLQASTGELTSSVTELFSNIHIIKTTGAEKIFWDQVDQSNHKVYKTNMALIRVRMFFFPLLMALTGLSQLISVFYGGFLVLDDQITVGDILAFNIYLGYLAFPFTSIGMVLSIYQRAKSALERIREIYDYPTERDVLGQRMESSHTEASLLRVEGLSFRHDDQGKNFGLNNVSFEIYTGEKIGLYGPVGSGKTTLLNILVRLYDPPRNSIYFSGQDICDVSLKNLRGAIGYALQSPHLFSDSVGGNLSFGIEEKVDDALINQSLLFADLEQDVSRLEKGVQTQIGERGVRLSGGQKQRLSLARLSLRSYQLILLDDVLSAVDHETEEKLISRFDSL